MFSWVDCQHFYALWKSLVHCWGWIFKATFLTHFPPESGILELKWATEFCQVIFKQSLYLSLFLLNVQCTYIYILKSHSFKTVCSVYICKHLSFIRHCSLPSPTPSFLFFSTLNSLALTIVCRLNVIFFSQFTYLSVKNCQEMYITVIQYFIFICLRKVCLAL